MDVNNEENKKHDKPFTIAHYANEGLYGQSEYDMVVVVNRKEEE